VLQHNGIPLEGGIQIAIRINWAQAVLILILINQTRKERNTAYNGASFRRLRACGFSFFFFTEDTAALPNHARLTRGSHWRRAPCLDSEARADARGTVSAGAA